MTDVAALLDQADALVERNLIAEAKRLYTEATRLDPDSPDAWYMLGLVEQEQGNAALAEAHLRRAIDLDGEFAEAHLNLANLLRQQSRFDEARGHARQAAELDERYVEAWLLFAALSGSLGEPADAEFGARRALALDPQAPQAPVILANALRAQGKFADAANAYRQALAENPRNAELELALASVLAQANELDEAKRGIERYLRGHPDSFEAWMVLGQLYQKMQDFEAALASYRKVVALQPGCAQARNNLGNIHMAMHNPEEAEAAFRQALAHEPDMAEALANMGVLMQGQTRYGEARKYFEAALARLPENAQLHDKLATMLELLGDFEGAMRHSEQAALLDRGNPEYRVKQSRILQKMGEHEKAYQQLRPSVMAGGASAGAAVVFAYSASRLGKDEEAAASLERSLGSGSLTDHERQRVHHALATVYDKTGRFDEAFPHFEKSNRLKEGKFNSDEHAHFCGVVKNTFSREFLASVPTGDDSTDRPLFIVGMPRSGTSLVEQILASHPEVHGAGELEDIGRLSHQLHSLAGKRGYFVGVADVTREKLATLAADYLGILMAHSAHAARVTDKMPHNFLHLGLIQMLFPKARVIHIRRDPLDTCLSCYFQEFSASHSYAYDLTQLGAYYRQYERLMAHWEQVLDLPMLHIRYEDLVDDQEGVSRRMVEFCGLEWDNRVLRFHETRRNVATPSFDQVRQPMYRKSVQRWKNYEVHLDPLMQALK